MIQAAARSDADLVFLDLEDSVAPDEKQAARQLVIDGLTQLDWSAKVRAVRINGLSTASGEAEVRELVEAAGDSIDVLLVPKVQSAQDVRELDALVSELEGRHGIREPIGFDVVIEDVRAVINVEEIACASDRMEALSLGPGDLAASQGVPLLTLDPASDPVAADPWMYARTKMVVAARAAGIDAIDGPTANIRDAESYLHAARRAAVLGAVGKWAVHPSQIALAHQAFSPTTEAVARAREVMAAFEQALAGGDGAVRVGDLMIDAASARIYQNILDFDDLILSKQNALGGSAAR